VDDSRTLDAVRLLNDQSIVQDAHRSFSQPGMLYVSTNDAASALPVLIALLKENNIAVQEAERYVPPFDDVFIELMKQAGGAND
jgi:hypothetical protein